MNLSKINAAGVITIPQKMRNRLGLKPGDRVIFTETEEGVLINRFDENYFKQFRGILSRSGSLSAELSQMKREEIELEKRGS